MTTQAKVSARTLPLIVDSLRRTAALRRIVSLAALSVAAVGCVPAKHYDEARSAAEGEVTAHGRTRSRLEAAHQRVRALEEQLARREQEIAQRDSSIAESRLETTVAAKERETALALVEQLRSELARTGNHLVVFSDEKRDLERALVLAEERLHAIEAGEARMAELVGVVRDLTLSLGETGMQGGVVVGARDGQVVLGLPAPKLFAAGSDALVVDAAPLLTAVGSVSAAHPALRVVVREPAGGPFAQARAARLGAALRDRGVPESQLVLPSRAAEPAEPAIAPVAVEAASPADSALPGDSESAPGASAPAPAAPLDESALVYEIAFAP